MISYKCLHNFMIFLHGHFVGALLWNGMVDTFYRCQTPISFSHSGMEGQPSFVWGNGMGPAQPNRAQEPVWLPRFRSILPYKCPFSFRFKTERRSVSQQKRSPNSTEPLNPYRGGPSAATGIAWQPIRVEPIFAKTPQESEITPIFSFH